MLEYFISILTIIAFLCFGLYIPTGFLEQYPDATDAVFYTNLGLITCLGILVFMATILLHEAGHLLFGLRAGMKFEEFSVLNFSFKNVDNKIKFIVKPALSGIGGYCKMSLSKDKTYDAKLLIWHLLGGILVNLFLVVVFGIILLISSNFLLTCVALLGIILNLYLGLLNSLPQTSAIGLEYDMLKVARTKEDEQYLIKLFTASTISEDLLRNVPVDKIHLECPTEFKLAGDILLGLVYTDILMKKEEFENAKKILLQIENENVNTLSKQNNILLKVQFIECELRGDCDINCLAKYWTKDIQQYIVAMSTIHPSFICFDYAYELLMQKKQRCGK